jgi:uncharacterized delta-60 repeat protein
MQSRYQPSPTLLILSVAILIVVANWLLPTSHAQSQVQVTAADPTATEQGTINLNVKVTGKGFKNGAKAQWFVTGTTNPGGVTVNSTTFVSSTELTANITVADTAVISNFDIQVLNSDGRGGKGTELFAVNAKSNSAPVQVLSADPLSIVQATSRNITVTGKSFTSGATVNFLVTGTTSPGGIVVNWVSNVTDTNLTVNITVSDTATVGNFDIKVTNPDGRSAAGSALLAVIEKTWGTAQCPLLPRPISDTSSWVGSGGLDYSFDFDGMALTVQPSQRQIARDLLTQPDGKIIVAGWTMINSYTNFLLLRYNTDGSLDNTFGDPDPGNFTQRLGYTFMDIQPGDPDVADSITLQSDGKIIVAGISGISSPRWVVGRYNADGTLDTTFGAGGKVLLNVGASTVVSLVLQSDGKIVLAGPPNFTVARLLTNGQLDTAFGTSGMITYSPIVKRGGNDTTSSASSVVIQRVPAVTGEERIVVGGSGQAFGLMRFLSNGAIDTSFGKSGRVLTTFYTDSRDKASQLAIDSVNRIVAGGTVYSSTCDAGVEFGVARYTENGALDTTFSGDGKVSRNVYGGPSNAYGLALQSNGKILIFGSSRYPNGEDIFDFTLIRYNTDGSADATFGPGFFGPGVVTTQFPGYTSNSIYSVAIQGDGNIVAGGGVRNQVGLARYLP